MIEVVYDTFPAKDPKKGNPVECKEIKKNVVNNSMAIDNFMRCLFKDNEDYREMSCVRSSVL